MYIISYNINGLKKFLVKSDPKQRTLDQYFNIKSNSLDFNSLLNSEVDIICFQETKLQSETDITIFSSIKKSFPYICFNNNKTGIKSYSGVAILSKHKFVNVYHDFDLASESLKEKFNSFNFSREGRIVTVEFEKYFLINIYTPNSKNDFSRLEERGHWEDCILSYILEITNTNSKSIILAGDFNVSLTKSKTIKFISGWHPQEINWFQNLLEKTNLVDCFDSQNSQIPYSYTLGLIKLDYFLCSKDLNASYTILSDYELSDHSPLKLNCEIPEEKLEPNVLNEKITKKEIVDEKLSLTLIDNFCDEKRCEILWNEILNSGDFKHPHKNKDGNLSKKRNKIIYGSIGSYSIKYRNKEIVTPVINWEKVPELKQLAFDCGSITNEKYNTCTIQYYNNGEVDIKPHRDKEMEKGTFIVSLSLGATRTMKFENISSGTIVNCSLSQGTLCIINPPTNDFWLHSIPKDSTTEPRISVIFRKI